MLRNRKFLFTLIKQGKITSLSRISSDCQSNSCYFLCSADNPERMLFILDAIYRGASVIVIHNSLLNEFNYQLSQLSTQNSINYSDSLEIILTDNVPELLAAAAALFFSRENPCLDVIIQKIGRKFHAKYQSLLSSIAVNVEIDHLISEDIFARDIFLTAVTGTNGKTSVAYLAAQLFSKLSSVASQTFVDAPKSPVALYRGTLGMHVATCNEILKIDDFSGNNTPDVLSMHEMIIFAKISGIQAIFFEASSHALVQYRVQYIPVNAAVITNITQEHLDYHGSVKNYSIAKKNLFLHNVAICKQEPFVIMHESLKHNEFFQDLIDFYQSFDSFPKYLDYGKGARFTKLTDVNLMQSFAIKCMGIEYSYSSSSIVDFFVENLIAASCAVIGYLSRYYQSLKDTAHFVFHNLSLHLDRICTPPGRMQYIPSTKRRIYIDYAHTDDALMRVLSIFQNERNNRQKLWLLFGCGGARDVNKRFTMGAIARQMSDVTIVTDDNPRYENSAKIRAQIALGYSSVLFEDYPWGNISDQDIIQMPNLYLNKQSDDSTGKTSNASYIPLIADRRVAIEFAIQHMHENDILIIAGKGHETTQLIQDNVMLHNDFEVAINFLSKIENCNVYQ